MLLKVFIILATVVVLGGVVITWSETSSTANAKLIDMDGTDQIEISSGAVAATSFPHATVYVDGSVSSTVDGTWHHVVVVDQTGVNATAMDIGRGSASYFNGILDDVRLYNRTLSADEIARLYKIGGTFKANTTISNDSLTQGLVGHWTFDGKDMSGVQAYDRSGNGNRGTLINGPTRVAGKLGHALQFDGANDVVHVGSGASIGNIIKKTISVWIKPRTLGQTNRGSVVESFQTDDYWDISMCDNVRACANLSNTFMFFVDGVGGGGTWYAPANTVKLNQWHHIVVEYDCSSGSNNPFFFYNGSQVSATQTATPGTPKCDDSAIPKYIGDEGVAGGFAFDGTIDDVRIYNRFLTADEIKRLYNMGR